MCVIVIHASFLSFRSGGHFFFLLFSNFISYFFFFLCISIYSFLFFLVFLDCDGCWMHWIGSSCHETCFYSSTPPSPSSSLCQQAVHQDIIGGATLTGPSCRLPLANCFVFFLGFWVFFSGQGLAIKEFFRRVVVVSLSAVVVFFEMCNFYILNVSSYGVKAWRVYDDVLDVY